MSYYSPDNWYYTKKYHKKIPSYFPNFNFYNPKTLAFKLVKFLAEAKKPLPRYQVVNGVWCERLKCYCHYVVYGIVKDEFHSGKELREKAGDWNHNIFRVARKLGYIDYANGWKATPKGKALVRRRLRATAK